LLVRANSSRLTPSGAPTSRATLGDRDLLPCLEKWL
jgi:hypothetical protein